MNKIFSSSPLATSLCLACGLLILLLIAFYANFFFAPLATLASLSVIAAELFLPFWWIEAKGLNPHDFGLYMPGGVTLSKELKTLALVSLSLLIPYCICYWVFMAIKANYLGHDLSISFNLPPALAYECLIQVVVVALPEECFYRGFLQNALLKKWSPARSIIITNIFFALGHFVGGFYPARLLTFFPGLAFSYLSFKNGNIFAAVIFHALCNIVGQILYASFLFK